MNENEENPKERKQNWSGGEYWGKILIISEYIDRLFIRTQETRCLFDKSTLLAEL